MPDLLLDTNAVSVAMAGREELDRYLAGLAPNTQLQSILLLHRSEVTIEPTQNLLNHLIP